VSGWGIGVCRRERVASRGSLGRIIEDAEGDAIRLIVEHLFLPVLDAGKGAIIHESAYVKDRLARCWITNLDEGDGNEAWLAQAANGLCDKPLAIRLGNN